MIVIDASVAVKWYRYEAGQEAAADLLEHHIGAMCAPDLFMIEVTAALVREANIHKPAREATDIAIGRFHEQLRHGDVALVRVRPADTQRAADLALGLGHPLKDCLYLILAMDLDCPLITADARFAMRARERHGAVTVLGA